MALFAIATRMPALAAALVLAGCGIAVPEDKQEYVGHWRAPQMTLLIHADGTVSYERQKAGGTITLDGPIQEFRGDDFAVGIGFISTTFEVSRPPWHDGSRWRMVVDEVELVRCADWYCVQDGEDGDGLEVEILAHGLFGPAGADGPRPIVESTSEITARSGRGFGVQCVLNADPERGAQRLTFRWDVPPMRDPDTGEIHQHWIDEAAISPGEVLSVGYDFEEDWEMVPGDWSLRILHGSQVLARKTFAVSRP